MELIGGSRAIVTAGLLLLAGLPLGGCSDLDSQVRQLSGTVSGQVADLSAWLSPPSPAPHHPPASYVRHPQSAPPAAAPTADAAAPAPAAAPAATPISIDGLSENAVRALLGNPAARAAAAPGETWIYRDASCELRLFLFPDVAKGGLHVLDHRITASAPTGADPQTCLHRLHDDHTG